MVSPNSIHFDKPDSIYLNEEQKEELASNGRTFMVTDVSLQDGKFGPQWEVEVRFDDNNEKKRITMADNEYRTAKFTAWQAVVHNTSSNDEIGPCVYTRRLTPNNRTIQDIEAYDELDTMPF